MSSSGRVLPAQRVPAALCSKTFQHAPCPGAGGLQMDNCTLPSVLAGTVLSLLLSAQGEVRELYLLLLLPQVVRPGLTQRISRGKAEVEVAEMEASGSAFPRTWIESPGCSARSPFSVEARNAHCLSVLFSHGCVGGKNDRTTAMMRHAHSYCHRSNLRMRIAPGFHRGFF